MTTANTADCFATFKGQRLIGVMFGRLPANRPDIARGTKTMVFEDGRGLTIANNGSYWVDRQEDVDRAIQCVAEELEVTSDRLREAMALTSGRTDER